MAISSDAEFYLVIGKAVGNAIDEVIEKTYIVHTPHKIMGELEN